MKSLWKKLWTDEAGVVLSSEIALVGTVGVLGMVVGLEAVTCAVTSELNDLASAFGAIDQTYNFRSIAKLGHARVSGSGFNDRRDVCDCELITQTDVGGFTGQGGGSSQALVAQSAVVQSAVVQTAPVIREEIIEERVIDEVIVEPKAVTEVCPDDEIIEERIIRRRVKADCSTTSTTTIVPRATTVAPKTKAIKPQPEPEKVETKVKKKN